MESTDKRELMRKINSHIFSYGFECIDYLLLLTLLYQGEFNIASYFCKIYVKKKDPFRGLA
ncbi:hypothetical protein HMPREF1863_01723 [Aedoeadaptatus coxii]|uniref:Uncharacterized protein n=1 Tax=Aedoeadaptatus coxii TaxID=755172 RepID=A0A134AC11_9FIRM|nr:hypothetical protein HMPREF1863_01723 [Peptoniphilus coxii]